MIIGIGGPSRSGKSTLALEMKAAFEREGRSVCIFDQDQFAFPEADLPRIQDRADWERPESMDFRRLEAAVREAADRFDVVIAEGILIFFDPALNALFDRRIFIDIDKEQYLERRRRETRWGPEPDWYLEYVWNCHLKWGRSVLQDANAAVEIVDRRRSMG